eukprot:4366116-Amphidinium_carterae.1
MFQHQTLLWGALARPLLQSSARQQQISSWEGVQTRIIHQPVVLTEVATLGIRGGDVILTFQKSTMQKAVEPSPT